MVSTQHCECNWRGPSQLNALHPGIYSRDRGDIGNSRFSQMHRQRRIHFAGVARPSGRLPVRRAGSVTGGRTSRRGMRVGRRVRANQVLGGRIDPTSHVYIEFAGLGRKHFQKGSSNKVR